MITLQDAHKEVTDLIVNLGVRALSFEEALPWLPADVMTYAAVNFNAFYDIKADHIAIKSSGFDFMDLDTILLHEIIHWTGSRNRLNRKPSTNVEIFHTEEGIAQMGMYKLTKILGIYKPEHDLYLSTYMRRLPHVNMAEVELESDKAVSFVLNFLKRKAA